MSDETLPAEQRVVKDRYIERRGFWSNLFDELLFLRPEYPDRYSALSGHPGTVLDRQVKELIHIAVDATTTHMYHRGTRSHVENAFEHGVTIDELVELFVLTSTIGIDSVSMGARLVVEAGDVDVDVDEESRDELRERLGYWPEGFDELLAVDPDHAEHWVDLASIPWEFGPLEEKVKYFVLLAVAVTPTRENETAARHHVENALDAGATVEEVMAVIETASVVGLHTLDSMAILTEEAARRGRLPEELVERPEILSFRDPRYLDRKH